MRKLLIVGAAAIAVAVPALSRAADAPTNLALGAVATASSSESAQYPGSNAIDGDPTTRWSSAFSDPQTLTVDLGARASISDISLLWEAAYGRPTSSRSPMTARRGRRSPRPTTPTAGPTTIP